MLPRITLATRLAALVAPVVLIKSSSSVNPVLELCYFNGRYQLATEDALYSDGNRYRPLVKAFAYLKKEIPNMHDALILGGGLGSAVELLRERNQDLRCTLVEIDEVVLEWAMQLLGNAKGNLKPQLADAQEYMQQNDKTYDLVVVDVFLGRQVPEFILGDEFLLQCRQALNSGGTLVLNYMDNGDGIEMPREVLNHFFKDVKILAFGLNGVFVCN